MEKLIELNLTAAKASLEESSITTRQLLAAKDPQEFFSLTAAQAQPTAEKAMSYSRQVAAIAAGTQAEFTKAAEAQIAETNRKVITLVDEVTKNAPAGSENVVAAIKAGIGKLKGRGAKFVSINPVKTGYSAIADEWVGIRPGTDGLFVGALIHVLLEHQKIDGDYLTRYTNAPWLIIENPGGADHGLVLRNDAGTPG